MAGGIGLANTLTLLRILGAFLLIAAFFVEGITGEALRLAILLAAAVTDLFDGRIARARGEVSRLGAALDPAADKALVLGALIMLAGTGALSSASLVAAAVIVLREAMVSGFREALGIEGGGIQSSIVAKWKTTTQMIALVILLGGSLSAAIHPLLPVMGEWVLWVSAGLAVWSGVAYARETWSKMSA